jgi:hypothetical protein
VEIFSLEDLCAAVEAIARQQEAEFAKVCGFVLDTKAD